MQKLLAYMITWTTYGTWLQGDERGYVKDGEVLSANPALEKSNLSSITQQITKLNPQQKIKAQNAIIEEAKRINHKIYAIAVCSNHIHIVAENNQIPMSQVVSRYKNIATAALKHTGLMDKIWSKGFDKRFCYDIKEINARIDYVNNHNQK
ncbi:MAG: hypothetical protein A2Y12_06705 [Planctomycetes bacterium GWF2_42_9]|nr:MAG: hypothetical protein A2Y12_06705 [Planctomycetes bacterium GWF2_42_9]HAL46107.1 hypothetical protein [Phycisphaerales bacterium]